jgi:hypothetical protein
MKAVVVFFVHNHKGTIASLKTVIALSDCSFRWLLGDIQIVGGWVSSYAAAAVPAAATTRFR